MSTTKAVKVQRIEPYLYLEGRAEEAIEFYKQALGAEVEMMMRFKDMPPEAAKAGCGPKPQFLNKIMHATLKIGGSKLLISDGRCDSALNFNGFSLTISVATPEEADQVFAAIGAGGRVLMPLEKTFFSPKFGMTSDKFGVMWVIITQH